MSGFVPWPTPVLDEPYGSGGMAVLLSFQRKYAMGMASDRFTEIRVHCEGPLPIFVSVGYAPDLAPDNLNVR
jgi:hypothetical protein